jgi:hypothetical protein
MAVKYVKDFSYPKHMGFHAASGHMSKYAKGGSVKAVPSKAKDSYKDMPARAKPNAPAHGAPKMESKPKMGKGQGYAMGGRVPGYDMDRLPAKKPPGRTMDLAPSKPEKGMYEGYKKGGAVEPPKPSSREGFKPLKPMAPQKPYTSSSYKKDDSKKMKSSYEIEVYGEPIKYTREDEEKYPAFKKGGKVAKVMREYKAGELHSGSKKGPVVKNRKQAVAIALSEARKAGEKVAKKAKGGEIFSTEYLAYGDKKGPYRGSPKKAKMLGRQDRRAREAMERAEKYAPGMSLDMKAKGGMAKHSDVKMDKAMMRKAVHKHESEKHPGEPKTKLRHGGVPAHGRKPMYGGGKC